MTLPDLIAALERAEGPSPYLDEVIDDMALERGWRQERATYHGLTYTSSIDAALTLVPVGRDWHVQKNPSVSAAWALVEMPDRTQWGTNMHKAATPAIALCIAALKARAT